VAAEVAARASAGWLIAGFGYAGTLVLAATVLSVYKPWGRTRFSHRDTR
jgi:hypothetical protein